MGIAMVSNCALRCISCVFVCILVPCYVGSVFGFMLINLMIIDWLPLMITQMSTLLLHGQLSNDKNGLGVE